VRGLRPLWTAGSEKPWHVATPGALCAGSATAARPARPRAARAASGSAKRTLPEQTRTDACADTGARKAQRGLNPSLPPAGSSPALAGIASARAAPLQPLPGSPQPLPRAPRPQYAIAPNPLHSPGPPRSQRGGAVGGQGVPRLKLGAVGEARPPARPLCRLAPRCRPADGDSSRALPWAAAAAQAPSAAPRPAARVPRRRAPRPPSPDAPLPRARLRPPLPPRRSRALGLASHLRLVPFEPVARWGPRSLASAHEEPLMVRCGQGGRGEGERGVWEDGWGSVHQAWASRLPLVWAI
jgi:hypothetical protein